MSYTTGIDAQSILEESPDGVVVVDGEWRVRYANHAVEGIAGRERPAIVGEEIWAALPTLAGTASEAELRRARAESRPAAFEHRDAAADRYYVIYVHPDAHAGLVIYLRDLTLQKLAEDAASATARKYRMLMEQASDGILVMDRTTRCLEVNARLCAMLGYTPREILARHYADLIHPTDLAATPVRLDELLSHGSITTERLLLRKDGGGVVVEVGASVLADGRILTLFRDITARKQSEEILRVQSVVDELTGVYNRRGFIQAAERELRIAAHSGGQTVFLLMADLDNLKLINDTYGHAAGDDALVAAADVLRDVVRASDVVGRWGGDEFAVFVSRGADAALEAVQARITRRLERANDVDRPYLIALSLGAAFVRADDATTLEGLIAQADAALYADKRSRPAERVWRR
jgi:diguanylate cyclase (GGDEF)-like protein/PAS domain S-box-containing protein